MVCLQLKVYLGYLVAQIVLSLFLFGSQRLNFGVNELLGPVIFSVALYYLCKNRYKNVANVLVAGVILMGVYTNMSLFRL